MLKTRETDGKPGCKLKTKAEYPMHNMGANHPYKARNQDSAYSH